MQRPIRVRLAAVAVAGAALVPMALFSTGSAAFGSTAGPNQQSGNCGSGPGSECSDPSTTHITVTPYTGLTNNANVTVSGTGFTPNGTVGISMCKKKNVTKSSQCDLSGAKTVPVDASGDFSTTFAVYEPVVIKGGAKTIDCKSSGNCSVGTSEISNSNDLPAANEDVGFSS